MEEKRIHKTPQISGNSSRGKLKRSEVTQDWREKRHTPAQTPPLCKKPFEDKGREVTPEGKWRREGEKRPSCIFSQRGVGCGTEPTLLGRNRKRPEGRGTE